MAEAERSGAVVRETRETAIEARVHLDGTGASDVSTQIGFLDHMIDQVAAHGLIDITLKTRRGDLHIDTHHTIEDSAITLGQAVAQALGDRKGIVRMADAFVPLDEALAHVVIDISGRPFLVADLAFSGEMIGQMPVEMVEHFFQSFCQHAGITMHARLLAGRNDHHRAEALFKAFARAFGAASRIDPRRAGVVPSTKGVL